MCQKRIDFCYPLTENTCHLFLSRWHKHAPPACWHFLYQWQSALDITVMYW